MKKKFYFLSCIVLILSIFYYYSYSKTNIFNYKNKSILIDQGIQANDILSGTSKGVIVFKLPRSGSTFITELLN